MDRAAFIALSAVQQALLHQDVNTHNLANVNTTGFKAQLSVHRAAEVKGPGLPTRAMNVYSTPTFDDSQGPIKNTGRELDVALPRFGFLAVQLPTGEAYTRNGNLQLSETGTLTVGGFPVAGGINIPHGAAVTISNDGTVSVLRPTDPPNTITSVGKLKMVKGDRFSLKRDDDGFFYPREGALDSDPKLRLRSGMLESSNVDPAGAMVNMINNARRFQIGMSVIQNVADNEKNANQLLSLS